MQELGMELKQAREHKGLTLQQAQADTKIRTRYLEAIEQGEFSALPGLVYARGFIKSYAEYLGMDGQDLLERHNLIQSATESSVGESMTRSSKRSTRASASKSSIRNSRLLPQLVAGISVLAVLVAAYVFLVKSEDSKEQSGTQTQTTANAQNATPAPQDSPDSASTSTPTPQPEPPQPQVTVTQSAKQAYRTLYTVGNAEALTVTLAAQGNCWVQVTADGKVVDTRTIVAGDTRTWTAQNDLAVRTGNSTSITLKLNDTPVAFDPQLQGYTYEFKRQ